jgi:hypothetical protein
LELPAATKVELTFMLWVEIKCDKQREVLYMEKNQKTSESGKKLPEKTFRAGPISATLWKNQVLTKEGKQAEFMSVTFKRSYKDKETDEWKETNSLNVRDLPRAVVVLNKAYEHLVLSGQGDLAPEMQ